LDENKIFLNKETYFEKYLSDSNRFKNIIVDDRKYYFTPKMTYNFFKSMLHVKTIDDIYVPLNNTHSWDNLVDGNKQIFIDKMNFKNIETWFDISKNIRNLYKFKQKDERTEEIQKELINCIINTDWITKIIFECLTYNGILTFIKYNPQVTDDKILPNKNKFYPQWEKHLMNNVNLEPYKDAYHFLDNKKLGLHSGLVDMIKKSKWYTNFGADWIAQIQIFHHFINQRIMFVTGSTGAGKSTVYPFMMLYATKIINYKNNGKVFCTQPRIQPTVDNISRIAEQLGIPIKPLKEKTEKTKDKIDNLVKNICKNTADEKWLKSNIYYCQFKYKDDELTDDLYHPTLRLMTDGLLYSTIKNNYIFKKNNSDGNTFLKSNLFDVLLVDESHEHNPYMDMILTLCKFALYINNEITLGIISATMDDDESTYRVYYNSIDDNWKAPLKLDNYSLNVNKHNVIYTRGRIDRRIHLSVPFGGMNFDVKIIDNVKKTELEIVQDILSTSKKGDILIFKPGSAEITELVKLLNKNTPSNVLAIPFYKDIPKEILDNIVKKIQEPNIRKSIIYPKNYTIEQICDVPELELLPVGTYTRFIIIATNIAEASITIDTLEYMIDDGRQKIMYYNVKTAQSQLLTKFIAIPNKKQRTGRVGRSQPGTAYFTYDTTKLESKVIYKLYTDNINEIILDLLSTDDTYLFNDDINPYLASGEFDFPDYLRQQYRFYSDTHIIEMFRHPQSTSDYKNIIYPHSDGKYDLQTLIDKEGKFYIIHPNENDFKRDIDNNNTIKLDSIYENKIELMIMYFKKLGIFDINNKLTYYGQLLVNCSQLFELGLEQIFSIMDLQSFKYSVKNKKINVYRNIIWYSIFYNSQPINKINNIQTNSDFLAKIEMIPIRLLYIVDLPSIIDSLAPDLSNLMFLLKIQIDKIIQVIPQSRLGKKLNVLLLNYYTIKIKIEILEELSKPNSTILTDIKGNNKFKQSNIFKNIKMNNLLKISDSDIQIIKSLNEYEQTCFFICKNMTSQLLFKISGTPYYISYYNRNFKNIFQLSYNVNPYNPTKIYVDTNVKKEYRNNILFYLSVSDSNKIKDIMWIPTKIIYLIQKINPIQITRDAIFNKDDIIKIHGEEEANNIFKKIDIINHYIKDI
jgi:hypothetical protein